jgi:hypothetical protein
MGGRQRRFAGLLKIGPLKKLQETVMSVLLCVFNWVSGLTSIEENIFQETNESGLETRILVVGLFLLSRPPSALQRYPQS